VTDTGPDNDPYTIRPGDPHPGAPQHDPRGRTERESTGDKRSTDPGGRSGTEPPRIADQTLRRVRRLIMLSALASMSAIFVPIVGLVLGILTGVLTWRWWSDLKTPGLTKTTTVVVIFGAAFAIVIGGVETAILATFAPEFADYASCRVGANTHIARDKCDAAFSDALDGRLPDWLAP
jgi:hypothetical protein